MDSQTDVHDIAEEAFQLIRSKLINTTFSDYQRTPLFNHAKDVAKPLIDEFGCNDKVIIVI